MMEWGGFGEFPLQPTNVERDAPVFLWLSTGLPSHSQETF
jgi:hypothetical protein